jgi:hypothetical protein
MSMKSPTRQDFGFPTDLCLHRIRT